MSVIVNSNFSTKWNWQGNNELLKIGAHNRKKSRYFSFLEEDEKVFCSEELKSSQRK